MLDASIKENKSKKNIKVAVTGLAGILALAKKNNIKGPKDLSSNLDSYLYGAMR